MRKLKHLFGVSMLCAILASCNPDLIVHDWTFGTVNFHPITLRTPPYDFYNTQDAHGGWSGAGPMPNTVFRNFYEVFTKPSFPSGIHDSYITATVNHHFASRTFEYRDTSDPNLWPDRFRAGVYFCGSNELLRAQTMDVVIASGIFRRASDNQTGRIIWTWSTVGTEFTADNIVGTGTNVPLEINAGGLDSDGVHVRVRVQAVRPDSPDRDNDVGGGRVPGGSSSREPGSGRVPSGIVGGGRGSELPPPPRRGDELPGGTVFIVDDSRFTEQLVMTSNDRLIMQDNVLMIDAIQTDVRAGVLKVYATEATFNSMMFR